MDTVTTTTPDARPVGDVSHVARLWLADFRCFAAADLTLAPELTLLRGDNGQGKTSLLEAVGWIARARSFRGVGDAMVVRSGTEQAIVRAEIVAGTRPLLFEAEIKVSGRNRIRCNHQPISRARDLADTLRVTVFAPDDLALVKDGPAERRTYLDDLLVMLAARYDAVVSDYERVLKQRNALLRTRARDEDARATLSVFDEQLVRAGAELVRGRLRLVERLGLRIDAAYHSLAPTAKPVSARYRVEWSDDDLETDDTDEIQRRLRDAIERKAQAELDRGVTLVGPHRDELQLEIGGFDARAQASQGEQRTLALALRLAGHELVTELTSTVPVLLLDDVFSELDPARADALVRNLPAGQTLLTSAGVVPDGVTPQRTLRIDAGTVVEDAR